MEKLSDLPNIGADTERQLNEIGIHTYEELKKEGSMSAWLKIKSIDASACYMRLLGLEGAIQNIPKKYLPEEKKKELKEFYNQAK